MIKEKRAKGSLFCSLSKTTCQSKGEETYVEAGLCNFLAAEKCSEGQGKICKWDKITINHGLRCGGIFSFVIHSADDILPPDYPSKNMQVFCQGNCQFQKNNSCQLNQIVLSCGVCLSGGHKNERYAWEPQGMVGKPSADKLHRS